MKWKDIIDKYPDCWILLEAIEAHSDHGKRVVDKIAVLDKFNNSEEAMKAYRELHKKYPERELYVAHTKNKDLEIDERKWLSVRI
ncbi:hypothetical protein DFR79_1519 [Halanaerobium saccharolyticum]|uniref:Uncharacterized protein n=1 Tax=Halanaerobium saccharolyticum TaxID=43595 RepID=A0A4V6PTG1_9FIRM|nr:hypothetical protein [Halanaerobium saccharolyticum]TDO71133.1 hypothetical protein DFR79_1519 [Halanaerobium saccharolyticum]